MFPKIPSIRTELGKSQKARLVSRRPSYRLVLHWALRYPSNSSLKCSNNCSHHNLIISSLRPTSPANTPHTLRRLPRSVPVRMAFSRAV